MELKETVFIIDDDEAVRDSLELLIKSVGLHVNSFESAISFLENYDTDMNGCLIVDIRMPIMSGLELQDELISRNCPLPIIFISGHGDIAMAVKAIKKGAVDFIPKPFRDQDLLDCIQRALRDWEQSKAKVSSQQDVINNHSTLSPREKQVMQMMIEGKANKVIALDLGISQRTVEVHRSHVMEKMQAPSLAQLVKQSIILLSSPA